VKEGLMGFQCGDFFVLRGFGLISKGIRLLTSVRYGIPFRETFSHVESAINEKQNVSAEQNGVVIVDNDRPKVTDAYAKVYRFKKFDEEDKKKHEEESERHLGKRYAIWRYLLDTARIVSFLIIVFGWILALISIWVGVFLIAVFIMITLLKGFLRKKDKLTEDCAENQSLIYLANGRWFPLPNPRNEFPNGMVQVWENLVLNGIAVVVAERQKGGEWEWNPEEENNDSEN
jgi:hypothetical protein